MKNSVVLDSLSSFVKWSWPRGDEPAGFSWVKQICDPHYDISRCSDANTEYWRIQILLQFKNQLQLLIYSSAQYSDDDGAANTKNLGNMSRGGFPVVIHVVFLLDISATLTKWLFQKIILRRPGIEPGSTAWKAAMLTIIPPTPSYIITEKFAIYHMN